MKKHLFSIAILIFLSSCSAQKKIVTDAVIQKYKNSISDKDLRTNLTVIASDEMEGRETGSAGQKKAGLYMIAQYQKNGVSFPKGATDFYQKVPAEFMNKPYNDNLTDSENIWAFVEGTEKPEEIVVISAHYDHIGVKNGEVYNGADDDGSGTVALISIAKAFQKAKKDGYGPKRSILFLHVTGEEHGLHGSRFYSENPLFPIANTIANVNIDMIGRRDDVHKNSNNYIYVIGADRLSSDLDRIVANANKKFGGLALDYTFNDVNDPNHFYERSDHYNFADKGIPSVFLFSGVHEDYHQKTDVVSKIEFDALLKRTQFAFVIAWELANTENRPVDDKK
jgi:hypothetical protein